MTVLSIASVSSKQYRALQVALGDLARNGQQRGHVSEMPRICVVLRWMGHTMLFGITTQRAEC